MINVFSSIYLRSFIFGFEDSLVSTVGLLSGIAFAGITAREIILTPEEENGMKYVEGEFDDYSNRRRAMGPLAALCHLADVTSARIGFDHPLDKNDSWVGARRIRDVI